MSRMFLLILVLSVTFAQAQPQAGGTAQPVAPAAQTRPQPPVQPPAPVAPDAPVVTIRGLCPAGQQQSDSCTVVLTRQQFETMVSSLNISGQNFTPAALRSLATGFVTVLALADAGEKAGVEKDPRFQELMKAARTRALADAYRRYLQEKFSNPSAEEIEAYYKQNLSKFEETKIDRILVPKAHPKRSQENRAEFEKKAREVADGTRERAARGEDVAQLQAEVYKALAIDMQPPPTEVNTGRKGILLPEVEQDIKALKAGEVTKVEVEPSGFNIYKVRSRTVTPLEAAKAQIARDVTQKNIDEALKAATGHVHSDLNDDFFNPRTTGGPPNQRIPTRTITPGSAPAGRTVPSATNPANRPAQTPPK
ncbi:MAG TPA: peptidyl-prolyl cis-trans isomerase [Candidatus Angelobacter sp.]